MIKFNVPLHLGIEDTFVLQAIKDNRIGGDGHFSKACCQWMEQRFNSQKVVLTTSCSTALDMAAILCEFKPGDEVILPSYTFPTTASSLAKEGVRLVFVDIRPDTMNIDETLIEAAITPKTKAIMVMHYAGVACEMDTIMNIANRHNLFIIEDAAQGVLAFYKGRSLGSIGDFGTYSFHETKNYTMGEGGALLIRNEKLNDEADNLKDSGTDRQGFLKGKVSAYSWVRLGSSYMPSELSASYLYGQLINADMVNSKRLLLWNRYFERLESLEKQGFIKRPFIPEACEHNAHLFFIKTKDENERKALIQHLADHQIQAVFHYVPLHSSKAGTQYGYFNGVDRYTTIESLRLLRLPLYYSLSIEQVDFICDRLFEFYI